MPFVAWDEDSGVRTSGGMEVTDPVWGFVDPGVETEDEEGGRVWPSDTEKLEANSSAFGG